MPEEEIVKSYHDILNIFDDLKFVQALREILLSTYMSYVRKVALAFTLPELLPGLFLDNKPGAVILFSSKCKFIIISSTQECEIILIPDRLKLYGLLLYK